MHSLRQILPLLFASGFTALLGCNTSKKTSLTPPKPSDADAGMVFEDATMGNIDGGFIPPPPDAGMVMTGTFQLIVQSGGVAIPGIDVVLSHDDGSFISQHQTPASGILELEIEANTSVTLLARFQDDNMGPWTMMRQTYVGINPGDIIRFGDMSDESMPPNHVATASISVSMPMTTETVDEITVSTGCQSYSIYPSMTQQTHTVTASITSECVTDQNTFSVFAAAKSGDRVFAYAFALDVEVTSLVPGSSVVNLSNWSENFDQHTVKISNPRESATAASIELELVRKGQAFLAGENFGFLQPTETQVQNPLPMGFADGLRTRVNTIYGGGFGVPPDAVTTYMKDFAMSVPMEMELDMGRQLVPPVFDVELDRSNPMQWTLNWRTGPGDSVADAFFGTIDWAENNERHILAIYMPPDRTGSWRFPDLPESLAQFRPASNDPMIPMQLILLGTNFIDGYSDFIANHGPNLFDKALPPNAEVSASFGGLEF